MITCTFIIHEIKPSVVLTDMKVTDRNGETELELKTAKIYSYALKQTMLYHASKEQSGEYIEGEAIDAIVKAAVEKVYREL